MNKDKRVSGVQKFRNKLKNENFNRKILFDSNKNSNKNYFSSRKKKIIPNRSKGPGISNFDDETDILTVGNKIDHMDEISSETLPLKDFFSMIDTHHAPDNGKDQYGPGKQIIVTNK